VNDFLENTIPEEVQFDYGLLKPLLRKRFLEESNIRYDEGARFGEDVQLYTEMLFAGAVAWLTSEPLYVYRTPIGQLSGARSRFRRAIPQFERLSQVNNSYLDRYKDQIDAELLRLIRRRGRRFWQVHLANEARVYRREGRYLQYVAFVLANPQVIYLLVLRAYRRAVASVRGGQHHGVPDEGAVT
jgi:hypothetical protein